MAVTATRLLDNYIAGEWTPAREPTGILDVTNPATGESLARVPLSGAGDLDAAVAAAREALPAWRGVSAIGRVGVIGFSSSRYRSRSSNKIATKKTSFSNRRARGVL